jgi:hydrogenase nickel incorporation protein HypB
MFRHADLVLVTKADLLGVIDDFEVANVTRHVRALGNAAPVVAISARNGSGLDFWLEWLRTQSAQQHGTPERAAAGGAT